MDSDNESISETSDNDEVVSQEERERIRNEVASMSFEDLQKLKEKIGSKQYHETVFGTRRVPKTNFKRANKNRPREMSSKVKPRITLRQKKKVVETKVPSSRDPRFDPVCGTFDKKEFKDNYKFLGELKKKERSALQEEYNHTEDSLRKKQIKNLIQRMDNQIREEDKQNKQEQKIFNERQERRFQLKQGVKPIYKKKSVQKIEDLVSKYEDMKNSNKLQKHFERHNKKLVRKDRKLHEGQV